MVAASQTASHGSACGNSKWRAICPSSSSWSAKITSSFERNCRKNVLRDTFAKAGLPAEIEVYAGAAHGWCPPDSAVYNEAQAERAWSRLLVLFGKALA